MDVKKTSQTFVVVLSEDDIEKLDSDYWLLVGQVWPVRAPAFLINFVSHFIDHPDN